jgi:hypothetical protein
MIDHQDPRIKPVVKKYEARLLRFVTRNATKILQQMDADKEYQCGNHDVPTVPLFDGFLASLEMRVKDELAKAGFVNGTAQDLIADYHVTFYYSILPNLSAHFVMAGRRYRT